MNNSSFETVKISLDKELSGFDKIELGAGNWISFGYIPSDVTVYFSLDNNTNSKIKALQGLQIQAKHDRIYLWSFGTNPTEQMEVMHWGSNDIKLIMPPRTDFDSLESFGALAKQQMQDIVNNAILSDVALAQFNKIIHPYVMPTTFLSGGVSQANYVILFNKTLTCDKIKVNITSDSGIDTRWNSIKVLLNGATCLSINHIARGSESVSGEFCCVKGQTLTITSDGADTARNSFFIEEFTRKP